MTDRELTQEKSEQIMQLRGQLHNTDYKAIKYAEGELTEEEYAPIREQRKAWRNEINALRAEIAEIKASKEAQNENTNLQE
jgi:5-bromo-4-chloroindolyl phosphate hydrolysis protein